MRNANLEFCEKKEKVKRQVMQVQVIQCCQGEKLTEQDKAKHEA